MPDLFEITRRLVALGCGEPEGLRSYIAAADYTRLWVSDYGTVPPSHARAIWEAHAREWAAGKGIVFHYYHGGWELTHLPSGRTWRGPDLLAGIVETLA